MDVRYSEKMGGWMDDVNRWMTGWMLDIVN